MNTRHLTVPLLLAVFAPAAPAQECPVTTDVATYPSTPSTYPMTSNRYTVQYQLANSGVWTDTKVYVSYYGATTSSPYIKASNYPADTSMSFASIPASASTAVALRITKLWSTPFPAIGQVSVRPSAKKIHVDSVSGSTIQISTSTAANFAGDQFILWWNGDSTQSGAIQGLAFFLNPPYTRPTGSNVKLIAAPADLTGDLSHFDTLDFEGTVAVASTGALAFVVPANINNIFLGPAGWLQGKLRFAQGGAGHTRRIYGPGVLDVSRFNYVWRQCRNSPVHTDDGYQALSWIAPPAGTPGNPSVADNFVVDGIVITDSDYYNTDAFTNSSINNLKIIGWNGNNDGIQFGLTTSASNVFIRTGDDSLKMWGSYDTVTNATVWQNWNGGVVNLGWSDNAPGDDCLIDGLYVVKMDWRAPNSFSWSDNSLSNTNNAVVASLMTPGTNYGTLIPSVYRNIYVEDAPRVLFSLKIAPVDCNLKGLVTCPVLDPTVASVLNLNLENIFSPASLEQNPIGFEIVPGPITLPGSMNIGLTNVMLTLANGTVAPLTSANAATTGKVVMNGSQVNVGYASVPKASAPPVVSSGAVVNGADFAPGAPLVPGSIASVFGSNFGSSQAGVTVLIGGIVAPLLGVWPQQIDFQVPWQLSGQTQASLSVTSGDLTSAPVTVHLGSLSPGIFLLNYSGQAAALIANATSIAAPVGAFSDSRPAQRGESISIYCTGLGAVTRQPATGAPAAASPASLTSAKPIAVSIGGVPATVSSSGLVPGYVGFYQINVQVPSNSPIGPAVPLTISIGGMTSNQASIAVAAAGS